MLSSQPERADSTALTTWKKLDPLNVNDIIAKSGINNFDVNSDSLEFKRVKYANGGYSIGQFKKGTDTWHGICRYVNRYGNIFEGMCQNGSLNGYGRYFWPNGGYYVGMWKDSNRHGQGKLVHVDGTVEEGEWKDHNFIGGQ